MAKEKSRVFPFLLALVKRQTPKRDRSSEMRNNRRSGRTAAQGVQEKLLLLATRNAVRGHMLLSVGGRIPGAEAKWNLCRRRCGTIETNLERLPKESAARAGVAAECSRTGTGRERRKRRSAHRKWWGWGYRSIPCSSRDNVVMSAALLLSGHCHCQPRRKKRWQVHRKNRRAAGRS